MIPATMDHKEFMGKASQILDEERVRPTVGYEGTITRGEAELAEASPGLIALIALKVLTRTNSLQTLRNSRPRQVREAADEYEFKSANYELLLALYSQVRIDERASFVTLLLNRIRTSKPARSLVPAVRFPASDGCGSEIPLVTEFCIRTGHVGELSRAIAEAPESDNLLFLLLQLEETIALNFSVFSDSELEGLATALVVLRTRAHEKSYQYSRPRGVPASARVPNPKYNPALAETAELVATVCDGLIEECQQARFWYLKGALQQKANVEINLDKSRVMEYLTSLGFSEPLVKSLNAAEQNYRATATPFELKTCLGHLRSFLEGLHQQACRPFSLQLGKMAPTKWGDYLQHLRDGGLLSPQEERFAAALFTLLSDEGVHPLMAEPEYARLLRNVVIEYGLMFLTKLDKGGVKLQ
jgi:hypothetical protein